MYFNCDSYHQGYYAIHIYCLYVLRTNDSAVVFIIFRYFR